MSESESQETYQLKLTGDGVTIDKPLDPETARAVLAVAMGGTAPTGSTSSQRRSSRRSARKPKPSEGGAKPKRRSRQSPGIVKDLSMRPKGKKTFKDFVAEKNPRTHTEKQIVIVHW